MTRQEMKAWLYAHDCHIHDDITSDCTCDSAWCKHIRPVFVIRTEHDPSVGIFGAEIGPWCSSEDEVCTWLSCHLDEAERLVCPEEFE